MQISGTLKGRKKIERRKVTYLKKRSYVSQYPRENGYKAKIIFQVVPQDISEINVI